MPRQGRLDGRACLIVGGTGGIGLAVAGRFLDEGARVVVTGADRPAVAGAIDRLADLGTVAGEPLDLLGDEVDVDRALDACLDALSDRLDVLVHVAGISGRRFGDGPLHECTADGWDRVTAVNARGVFLTNRHAVRRMLAQDRDETGLRGTVLNVGSVLDRSPSPHHFGTVAYAASKGAVAALTRAAAAAYAPERIRCNLLLPALIDTPMAGRAVGDPAIRAYLGTKQPIAAGPGAAADVAEAALALCEPATRFVTGAELVVDGGWCVSEGQIRDL